MGSHGGRLPVGRRVYKCVWPGCGEHLMSPPFGSGKSPVACPTHHDMYRYYMHVMKYYEWLSDMEWKGGERWKDDYKQMWFDDMLDPKPPPSYMSLRDLPSCVNCPRHCMEDSIYCFACIGDKGPGPNRALIPPAALKASASRAGRAGAEARWNNPDAVESEEWRLAYAGRFE